MGHRLIAFFIIFASSCDGPRYYNCPDTAAIGADAALMTWDSAAEILERADIHCQNAEPYAGVPCIIKWYGRGKIPGERAQLIIQNSLAGECMIHELHHGALYVDFADGCTDHSTTCGWNYYEIDRANDIYFNLLENKE